MPPNQSMSRCALDHRTALRLTGVIARPCVTRAESVGDPVALHVPGRQHQPGGIGTALDGMEKNLAGRTVGVWTSDANTKNQWVVTSVKETQSC